MTISPRQRLAAALALVWALLFPAAAIADDLFSMQIDGRKRTCRVHVPPKLDRSKPAPLVLVFHGAGGNGKWQQEYSGLNAKADEAGFIAAYPDGTGRMRKWMLTWNAGSCCGYSSTKKVDDLKFVEKLLDWLEQTYRIDSRRVYAAGLSNGGMLCYRLAETMSDRIAAIAVVSGTQLGDPPDPKRPVPVLHFHGTKDKLVPFKGGSKSKWSPTNGFRGARATTALWAKTNGCPPEPVRESLEDQHDDSTKIEIERYGPGRDGSEVVLYVIEGGGHTWPGRFFFSHIEAPRWMRNLSPLGKTTTEISANDILWEFFRRHPMPTEAPAPPQAAPRAAESANAGG